MPKFNERLYNLDQQRSRVRQPAKEKVWLGKLTLIG